MTSVFRRLFDLSRSALDVIDRLFAATWWLRWRQWRAERTLDASLQQKGELSFQTHRATEHVGAMDFAVRFWRDAPLQVRRVAEQAVEEGVPLEDVRLMILNRDLLFKDGKVRLRRLWLNRAMAFASTWLFVSGWLLLVAQTFSANGPWALKVLVALAFTAIYAFLHRGFTLFASRGCAAIDRSGARVEAILEPSARGRILVGCFGRPDNAHY